jgi:hypothetical protein
MKEKLCLYLWRLILSSNLAGEKYFTGTLGSSDYSGPDEYRICVGKDIVNFDHETEIYYSAEMLIGRRWGDHVVVNFHDELSPDKTKLLYGMRQMVTDLQDAIKYLESL